MVKKFINKKNIAFGSPFIAVVLLIFLFAFLSESKHTVKISSPEIDEIGDLHYAFFDIKNPTSSEKSCSVSVKTLIGDYPLEAPVVIPAKSSKSVQVRVEVPGGESKFDVMYGCKDSE